MSTTNETGASWATNESKKNLLNDETDKLHSGLTVDLIATPRDDFKVCFIDDAIEKVLKSNKENYDFFPVIDPSSGSNGHITGLFNATLPGHFDVKSECVKDHFMTLSENLLIGADASILNFVRSADKKPCRLVVSGGEISGLVSLSDLQKLPVRASLFALITGFEMVMIAAIKKLHPNEKDWKKHLSDCRLKKINDEIKKSKENNGFIDELSFTQLCDKRTILMKSFKFEAGKNRFQKDLKKIETLRNNLAHANKYAATQDRAKEVSVIIRLLQEYKKELNLKT